ncbi:hypothetical protein [Corynebacterium sp. Marseille-P4611]|nr:hypothetical protein [Corynebacterium sp. Marseille-P4611]
MSEHQREQLVELFEQGVGYRAAATALEVSQVLFRLSRWENLEYAKKI